MVLHSMIRTPDGIAHRVRETEGDCHLTVCGKFARGRAAAVTAFARTCLDCTRRLDEPVIRCDPEQPPAAVRMGRGCAGRVRRGPPPKGAPFE